MTVETFVLEARQIEALRARLVEHDEFEFRPLQYGYFSARGPRVVINAYRSGKVVIQGAEAAWTRDRFVADLGTPAARRRRRPAPLPGGPLIGSDEAGKGDYFGPLVVAGVALEAGREMELRLAGAVDCKRLTDERVFQADDHIRESFPHAVVVLEPEAYNRAHTEVGNVNEMLGRAHAEVIATLRRQVPDVARALVDRFGDESIVAAALAAFDVEVELFQQPRAEEHLAVAAASVVARAAYLRSLDILGALAQEELPRGGANAGVLETGRRILRREGMTGLRKVAKLHFRTTARLSRP